MLARLERILNKLAKAHQINLPPINPNDNPFVALDEHALILAREANVLVLVGNLPGELAKMRDFYVNDWINGYALLYNLLAGALFPGHNTIGARDADHRIPPIASIEGDASPLFPVFYTSIVPYLQQRQPYRQILEDHEIRGFLDYILIEELFADDLEPQHYRGLLDAGVEILRQMLNAPIGHIRIKTILPPQKQTAPPPPGIPGLDRLKPAQQQSSGHNLPIIEEDEESQPTTPTEQMFINIPIWRSDSNRTPPVPPLPPTGNEDDEDNKNGNRNGRP